MKLNKRYVRSIRANLPFYIAASVLTMVTLLMFYLFYIAGTGINAYGDKFFSEYRLESATFTTYKEIPDDELPVYVSIQYCCCSRFICKPFHLQGKRQKVFAKFCFIGDLIHTHCKQLDLFDGMDDGV